ncbi:MAG: cardiolipin synthase [Kurthia sp.]|nr:cardiolipin synthase [Candidatus Kurthia equi]
MVKFIQTLLMALLVAAVAYGLYKLDATYLFYIGLLFQIFSILVAIKLVFNDSRETPNKIAWIVVVLVLPALGTIMYLFFGRDPRSRIFTNIQIRETERLLGSLLSDQERFIDPSEETDSLAKRIENLSRMKSFSGNKVAILTNGEAKFTSLFEELEKATDHIHMQYYIFNPDDLGLKVRDKLIEKAKQGISVRFLYDGWGSSDLKHGFLQPMKRAGIEVLAYDPIRSPWIVRTANLRNHRKIVIIDGKVAFTGGLNVGNEYISKTDDFKNWRDTHLRIEGPSVAELQASFLVDWVFVQDREGSSKPFTSKEGKERYFMPDYHEGNEHAQVIWGGPYDSEKVIRDAISNLIDSAKHSIYISTPYFVPDEETLAVVRRAALSGIEVKVLIPGKGDSFLSFNATNSYRKTLLKAGVRVFNYDNESFIHNKIIIVDNEKAAIGTANFDIRSFQLNQELMVFLYDGTASVHKLQQDFLNDCEQSEEYTMAMENNKSIYTHIKESICRMFSPIL